MISEGPIYITGTFRSGSTLISQILNANPNVSLTYDTVKFLRFSYNKYNPITEPKNLRNLISDIHHRIFKRHKISINITAILHHFAKISSYSYAEVYNEVMKQNSFYTPNTIWGEKENLSWRSIPDFYQMFPNGRVLHIVRDPRGVLSSWKSFTHAPGFDYLDMVFNCIDSMQHARTYQKKYKDKRYYVLRYEDLVAHTETEVRSLCSQIEIEYHDDMINAAKFTDRAGNPWTNNSEFTKKMDSITADAVNTWKKKLDISEISFTEYFCSEMMASFAYKKQFQKFSDEQLKVIYSLGSSSDLVTKSALKYLITKQGVEQFPLNPLDPTTWDQRLK